MRRVIVLMFAALALLIGAPVSSAHDVLETTNPSDGATLEKVPQEVTLTFSDTPLELGAQIVVNGPNGPVQQGTPTVKERTVTQPIAGTAPGGDYTVSYRITSSDGHPVTGTFRFYATTGLDGSTATAGPTAANTAPAVPGASTKAEPASSFVPVVLTIVGMLILGALAGFLMWRSSRRTAEDAKSQAPSQAPDDRP